MQLQTGINLEEINILLWNTLIVTVDMSRHVAYIGKVRRTECSRKGEGEVIQLRVRG